MMTPEKSIISASPGPASPRGVRDLDAMPVSPYKERPQKRSTFPRWCYALGACILIAITVSQVHTSSTKSTLYLAPTEAQMDDNENAATDPFHKGPPRSIKRIAIIGERNSGTRWTFRHLTNCFNHSVPVTTKLTRYKHWFQYPEGAVSRRYPHDTLVIAQFRNPYEWLKAMQHVPHHSPNHLQYRDDQYWKQFLTSPWTMERVGTDLTQKHNYTKLLAGTKPCQEHFEYQDIISCEVEPVPKSNYDHLKYSEHQPFYEMRNDGSGLPYDNIMELRTDKIRNFLSVQDWAGIADVWVVQYEYLVTKGTQKLIQQISDWTGIKPNCTASPPQQRPSRPVEAEMAEFIRKHLNWTVESWIGYGPHD